MRHKQRIVVGVTGASGVIYAERLLQVLCPVAEVHLVVTKTARDIARFEGVSLSGSDAVLYDQGDLAAPVASGSHPFSAMVVIPCSVKSLAAIANGFSDNLVTRCADVCLKERRPCILVIREMPLSRIHLRNMLTADEAGATVMVASPAFYHRPTGIQDLIDMVVARVLDHLGVEHTIGGRWHGIPT